MANKSVKLLITINESLPAGKVLSLPSGLAYRLVQNEEAEWIKETEPEQAKKYVEKVQKD